MLAITRDIDERKRYERRLREQHNELAHVCRVSTLGELASGPAHQLKQPLCAISSCAESAAMLNDSGDSSDRRKARRILQKIVSDTGRANAIIQRLRNFVRKRAPRPQLHDASQLIRETLEIVESEKGRHGARIAVSIADSLRPVWVDRVQTRQVILHFVNNVLQAIDDAAEANRAIELTICENGEMIRVSLRDFAPGIPDHVRPRLFVPFLPPNRVDSAWDYR